MQSSFQFVSEPKRVHVHQLLWNEFGKYLIYLSDVGSKTLLSKSEYQEALPTLDFVGQSIKTGWLSSVRNDINYRHHYGVWFPHNGINKAQSRELTADRLSFIDSKWLESWTLLAQDSSARTDCNHFFQICRYISNIAIEMAGDLNMRSGKGLAFRNGIGRASAQLSGD